MALSDMDSARIIFENYLIDSTRDNYLPLLLGLIKTKQAQEHLERRIKKAYEKETLNGGETGNRKDLQL